MKKTKVNILAIVCLLSAMALSFFATSVKATTMEFGLEEYRKLRDDGMQYAYKLNNKHVWKTVTYNGQTVDYDKTIYTLKAMEDENIENKKAFKETYDKSYDFKNKNLINTFSIDANDYNSIIWILNHAYVKFSNTENKDKENLIKNAQITEKSELTDDDIDVIFQLAIWYFTNKDNKTYHMEENGIPVLQTVLESKKNIDNNEEYIKISDENSNKYNQMEKLFKYIITEAKNATEEVNKEQEPIKFSEEETQSVIEGNSYVCGPFTINKENDSQTIFKVIVTDNKDKELNNDFVVLDENRNEIKEDLVNMIGQKFYIKIPINKVLENNIESIKIKARGIYTNTIATYWTNSSNNNIQPMVVLEKEQKEFNIEKEITIVKEAINTNIIM